ncbi:MAG: tRNA 4-thiouridine(8) synthase ThiI [Oscillospiraceae bacterium]|jgi:thiamine biosynthesis protein ThiI|nr:tRNA 4-thiouridine(8) synthase ThiI [Oscillospiraceae bacterium]
MNEIILLKLGEVVLKGLNRRSFEDKLVSNIRRRLQHYGSFHVYSKQSTIYVEPQGESCDLDGAYAACKQVFGIIAATRARSCPKDKDAIFHCARHYLDGQLREAATFKVETKRADKHFPMNSMEISQYVGGLLHDAYPHLKVDVHSPQLCVHVEVREKAAYVHGPSEPGAGGLPIGMGGTAVSLLSGGIDSPAASYMIAKRGVQLELVHFFSPPYTSQQALDKVKRLARELTPWCGRMKLHIVPFTEIQEAIRRDCPEDHFTLIMRRFMMRLAQAVARRTGAKALVTGESLGQVASQTMDALAVSDEVCELPVLRPVIGMDKQEIVLLSRRIGTFETSIQPFEDCCTVFTPRHPKTHPHLDEVREYEKALDVEGLVERALAGIERVQVAMED